MTDHPGTGVQRHTRRRRVVVLLVLATAVGYGVFRFLRTDADTLVQRAQDEFALQNYAEARDLARRALKQQSDHLEALIVAADSCFALDEFDQALEYYQKVPPGPNAAAVHAVRRSGRIEMHHRGNAVAAEEHFRTVLRYQPDDPAALFQLVSLLGIESRRRESIPLILRLFRQGRFHGDFLSLLYTDNGALFNETELRRYHAASPNSPAVLVGVAWNARVEKNDRRALELLRRALKNDAGFAEAEVALARLLWDLKKYGELRKLLMAKSPGEGDDPRLWVVRGRLAHHDGQAAAAVRCFWEAFRGDPANADAAYKLFQYLDKNGRPTVAASFRERTLTLQSLRVQTDRVTTTELTTLQPLRRIVEQLERIGRLWEAWGWCRRALKFEPNTAWAKNKASELEPVLKSAPLELVCRRDKALAIDLSHLPLPEWNRAGGGTGQSAGRAMPAITFRDDAGSTGVEFRYFNSPSPRGSGQRMYEFNGGGCGVLDYDKDGWPDLYLTQGSRWPVDEARGEHLDRLFRNQGGVRFDDATGGSGLRENRFSTGVAIGDYDNDGFDDVYVANIGRNRLFQNNGDGTFDDVTEAAGVADAGWSTSCVVADLNGDGLPDIYSANYLEGPSIFDAVCKHRDGRPRMCMPYDFAAAQDQLYLNRGDGRFVNVTATSGVRVPGGKGLGVVAADWQGNGRLDLFVANDTVANFYFENEGTGDTGAPRFRERALSAGVALNQNGRAEGCMGIALGDCDGNGTLDLFVTNFLRESNTLYLGQSGRRFHDGTRRAGLSRPSLELLGFGTQFLDADLDGRLDLLLTNGHIDDYRPYGRPYKMPAQFFWNAGQARFTQLPAGTLGTHFSRKQLGRGLARLDWNRDGREDAVISHLDAPAALLTNTTRKHGAFITLRLVGTRSSRDAIGTTVSAKLGNRTIMRQLSAGDGYQASNQRALVFGLGEAESLPRLEIRWPSGKRDVMKELDANHEYLVVEGSGILLRLR